MGTHAARDCDVTRRDDSKLVLLAKTPWTGSHELRNHRTKKELGKLIRELNPLPGVPDCIEPLGPSLPQTPRTPTWAEFAASLCPPIRELPAGERPRDWANDGSESLNDGESLRQEALPVGPVPANLPPITGPQHYQMQFSAFEEHVQLIARAKALLARERHDVTLGELHLEAMRMFAKPAEPGQREPSAAPRQRVVPVVDRREPSEAPRQRVSGDACQPSETPRLRTRYIPTAQRREVYRRDCGRCTYVDARGERRCGTRYLELHHLQPFARQGAHVASNLALGCQAHNQLAAEQDFGPEHMAQKRDSLRHEALGAKIDANTKR